MILNNWLLIFEFSHEKVISYTFPKSTIICFYQTYLNRPYLLKPFKGCLPQISFGPFLNTLPRMFLNLSWLKMLILKCVDAYQNLFGFDFTELKTICTKVSCHFPNCRELKIIFMLLTNLILAIDISSPALCKAPFDVPTIMLKHLLHLKSTSFSCFPPI